MSVRGQFVNGLVPARETMGWLFQLDPYQLSHEETVEIMHRAFK